LGKVDGSMPWKDIPKDSGKDPDGEKSMGNPALKSGFFCIGLVEMNRVKITRTLAKSLISVSVIVLEI